MLFLQGLSNLRMAESKSAALPLGYAPMLVRGLPFAGLAPRQHSCAPIIDQCRSELRSGRIANGASSSSTDFRPARDASSAKARARSVSDQSLLSPPSGFVAAVMDFPVMTSTQWHGELIADLASECWMLRVSQMMGI